MREKYAFSNKISSYGRKNPSQSVLIALGARKGGEKREIEKNGLNHIIAKLFEIRFNFSE